MLMARHILATAYQSAMPPEVQIVGARCVLMWSQLQSLVRFQTELALAAMPVRSGQLVPLLLGLARDRRRRGFLTLIQQPARPARYGDPKRFDTMASKPSAQAACR